MAIGMLNRLPDSYRVLIIGSTGTIGSAFQRACQSDPRCAYVGALSRSSMTPLILESEESVAAAAEAMRANGPFHLILDATGALTIDGQGPEKRLAQLSASTLSRAFQINAIGRGLVLKYFIPLLAPKERAIFAVMSARVGSIEDNHLGGWYGYRASKAAGNMLLQTAAIESHRTRPLAVFAALQPGTVVSKLSAPFQSGHHTLQAEASVAGLLRTLDGLEPKGRAWFVDYDGQEIPW
ncbi:C factor cell-cell signaling protein [Burkholderiales bacterium]